MLQNLSRTQLIIGGIVLIFLILPIILSLIILIFSNNNSGQISSNVEPDATETIAQFIGGGDELILREIGHEGNYMGVATISIAPIDYGNSTTFILYNKNDEWQVIYYGTGYDKSTLAELGMPDRLINTMMGPTTSQYVAEVVNSPDNPINKYPLINKLPYHEDTLSISYTFDDDGSPVIEITATNAYRRERAIDAIYNLGYSPADYHIVFKDFTNPFTGGSK